MVSLKEKIFLQEYNFISIFTIYFTSLKKLHQVRLQFFVDSLRLVPVTIDFLAALLKLHVRTRPKFRAIKKMLAHQIQKLKQKLQIRKTYQFLKSEPNRVS